MTMDAEVEAEPGDQASRVADDGTLLDDLIERAESDAGAAFEPAVLRRLVELKAHDPQAFEVLRAGLKGTACRLGELDKAMKSWTHPGETIAAEILATLPPYNEAGGVTEEIGRAHV